MLVVDAVSIMKKRQAYLFWFGSHITSGNKCITRNDTISPMASEATYMLGNIHTFPFIPITTSVKVVTVQIYTKIITVNAAWSKSLKMWAIAVN